MGVFYDFYNYSILFHLSYIFKQLNIKSYILISKSIIIFILNQINLSNHKSGGPETVINKFLGLITPYICGVVMLKVKITLDLQKTIQNVNNCKIKH